MSALVSVSRRRFRQRFRPRSYVRAHTPAREAGSVAAQGGGDYELVAPAPSRDYAVITSVITFGGASA